MAIDVDGLSNAIVEELRKYTSGVVLMTKQAAIDNAKQGVKMLKNSYATKRTGKYNSGWKMRKKQGKIIIFNAKSAHLTHLLENGHAKVGGGRVEGTPHISLVEQQVIANYEADVRRAVETGGNG